MLLKKKAYRKSSYWYEHPAGRDLIVIFVLHHFLKQQSLTCEWECLPCTTCPLAGKETARNHEFVDSLMPFWERTYPVFKGTFEDGRVTVVTNNHWIFQGRHKQVHHVLSLLLIFTSKIPTPNPNNSSIQQQLKHSAVIFDIGTSFLLGWPVFLCCSPWGLVKLNPFVQM